MSHPFGDLLTHYRSRQHGLSQAKLAEKIGYDPSVITRMAQGQRDLTGPAGRERVLRVIRALGEADTLNGVDEANALLAAADMPLLYAGLPDEAALMEQLRVSSPRGATVATPRHNLPVQLTSFVGREREMASVKQMLAQHRLITLTGPGGVGKTRLAIEIGAQLLADFADGVWLVSLTPLTDGSLVAQTVAAVLARDQIPALITASRDLIPTDALIQHIAHKHLLLILDNCEHLVDACAHLADHLLSRCPNLRVLVTSREVLAVPGEITWRIPPLAMSDSAHAANDADSEAVRLFVARAKTIQPDFELTPEGAIAAAQVCERLDGIPLALELAAALMQTFTVQEIAARLDEGIVFSASGLRTPDQRHRTLGKAVDWSYHLLSPEEQHLLARLSVFSGGWTAEAAQAVCTDDAVVRASRALPLMRQLAQKSLVVAEQGAGRTRYRLLRTIRDYATEKLNELGETEPMHIAHLNYFAQFAAQADDQLAGAHYREWDARLEDDYNNIRAALAWSKDHPNHADMGLRLASRLAVFWEQHGFFEEGLTWIQQALKTSAPLTMFAQAQGHFALLHLHLALSNSHEYAPLLESIEQLLVQCRELGDDLNTACLCDVAGEVLRALGKFSEAKIHYEESLHLFEKLNNLRGIAATRIHIAQIAYHLGDHTDALEKLTESIQYLELQNAKWSLCQAYEARSYLFLVAGDQGQCLQDLKRVATIAEEESFLWHVHEAYCMLESIDNAHAIELGKGYLERQRQRDDQVAIGLGLHQLGRMYFADQRVAMAGVVLDEAIQIWRNLGLVISTLGIGLASSLLDRGQVARFQGELDLAERCYGESIRYFKTTALQVRHAYPILYRGHVHLARGNFLEALADFREALQLFHRLDEMALYGGPFVLNVSNNMGRAALAGVAEVYHLVGHIEASAKMLGWMNETPLDPLFMYSMRVDYDRILATAHQQLSNPNYAAAWEAGKSITFAQAYALAMNDV